MSKKNSRMEMVMSRLKASQDQSYMLLDGSLDAITQMAQEMSRAVEEANRNGESDNASKLALAAACLSIVSSELAYRQAQRQIDETED